VLPIIIAIVAIVLGGGTIAVVAMWDDIVIQLKGKRFALLGERGVGKTTLFNFLTKGVIQETKQTVRTEKVEKVRRNMGDLELILKETRDVPGSKDAYAAWKDVFENADVVLYLFRADKIIKGSTSCKDRMLSDMRHIGNWLRANRNGRRFFLVGTHCDKDSDFNSLTKSTQGDYVDKIRNNETVDMCMLLAGDPKKDALLLGSLKTHASQQALVSHLLGELCK